jgi:hypothetical protein
VRQGNRSQWEVQFHDTSICWISINPEISGVEFIFGVEFIAEIDHETMALLLLVVVKKNLAVR